MVILEILERYYSWTPGKSVSPTGWTKVMCPNPEHDDTVASATVSIEFDRVKCFACGYRAGPVDIVMTEEDLSFRDALKFLAEENPVGTSPDLRPTTTRLPGRAVFGGGASSEPRRRAPVRPRVRRRPRAGT